MLHTLFALILLAGAGALLAPAQASHHRFAATVLVEPDEVRVGAKLCALVAEAAASAIERKGGFSFAISGGSMLPMLAQLDADTVEWPKATMTFVSHRCVALDASGATYATARPLFLDEWVRRGLRVLAPSGSTDAHAEARHLVAALEALPASALDFDGSLPRLDLVLVGLGLDGHVGSIYPNVDDADSREAVLAITGIDGLGKISTKISLSIAAMRAARSTVVACAGVSSKAPRGKAEACFRALEAPGETARSFPASALRQAATWLLDEPSAALLSATTTTTEDAALFGLSFCGGDPCSSAYNDDPFAEQSAVPDAMTELRRRVKAIEDAC